MVADRRERLRAELDAAAHRLAGQQPRSRPDRRWPNRVLVAAVVVAALTTVAVFARPDPAAANTFTVSRQGRDVVITVVGTVDDPAEARAELAEAGIKAVMVDHPVPPSLVGTVLSISSPDADVDTADGGGLRVRQARFVSSSELSVVVGYGRPAAPDETYAFTEPPPGCADLVGAPVDRHVVDAVHDEFPGGIEWRVLDGPSPPPETVPVGARVVTMMPLAAGRGAVFVVVNGPVPDGAGC